MLLHRWLLLMLCLVLAGCGSGSIGGDEQKEPYFLAGKNRLQARDYAGAIEMFEKALDVNPRSASAHFELGILYEQQQGDYPAALYHYNKAVTLRGDMLSADLARQRIQECKRELAKTVIAPISVQNMQKTIDELRADNQVLKAQLQSWQTYYAGRGLSTSNGYAPGNGPVTQPIPVQHARTEISNAPTQRVNTAQNPVAPRQPTPPAATRSHQVASGETFASIAKRYRISAAALQSANPTIDARKLKPGQSLVVPPP